MWQVRRRADEKPVFPDDLRNITVEGDGEKMKYKYAQVTECASIDGRYWFTFVEMPEATQLDMVEAQALYTALMTDTLLPEEE